MEDISTGDRNIRWRWYRLRGDGYVTESRLANLRWSSRAASASSTRTHDEEQASEVDRVKRSESGRSSIRSRVHTNGYTKRSI